MPLLILIALLSIPYLEFLVFVEVADEIGGISALLLTIFTAFLGIYIIRQEGIQVLMRLKETVDRGESPVSELIHGFFLAIAGFFFLLPGFLTDGVAILLAIAPIRAALGKMMVEAGTRNFKNKPRSSFGGGTIIDGEFEESDSPIIDQDERIEDKNNKEDKN